MPSRRVAYLASGYIRSHGDDLAHWLVAEDSRKIVLEGVQAFGAHRCGRCRLRASSPALDLVPVEAEEHP